MRSNLRSIMKLLASKRGRACLGADQRTTLVQALHKRRAQSGGNKGLWLEQRELDDSIKLMEATG